MKAGYRQLPHNPKEWATQIYSLGANEYYIDVCMPFGKSNSSKVFCHWVRNWVNSFKFWFGRFTGQFQLESYVDDVFGGAVSEMLAAHLKKQLIAVGKLTTARMNLDKCKGPAQSLGILGHQYNARSKSVNLPVSKQQKYLAKLRSVLAKRQATSNTLESLIGYLG